MEPDPLNPAEQEVEAALRGLRPAASDVTWDSVSYRAGARAARRRTLAWQGLSVALALALGISIIARPSSSALPIVTPVSDTPTESIEPATEPIAPAPLIVRASLRERTPATGYLALREDILAGGMFMRTTTSDADSTPSDLRSMYPFGATTPALEPGS